MSVHQTPCYEIQEFEKKQNSFCVCVFVINEGEKLLRQLAAMRPVCQGIADIVIADGGSTDGSTDLEKLKSLGVNTLLVKRDTGKLGSQMRMAFDWALKRGYEGVIVVDGNGKDGMDAIPHFADELKKGVDHVQGSRFIEGGYHENTPKSRLWGLKFLHAPLIRWASGFKYTDTTNGFRAYSAKLLSSEKLAIFRDCFTGYELHYYLAIEAARQGFHCSEIPVSRVYPATGKIPTKISGLKGNIDVMLKLLLSCFHLQTPGKDLIRCGKTGLIFLTSIIFACLAYFSYSGNTFSAVGKTNFERWQNTSENLVVRGKIDPRTRIEKWYSFHFLEPRYPGLQGIACSYICRPVENWPLERKVEMLHRIGVILTVLALACICFWVGTEFSLTAAILFSFCAIFCQFIVISARNLYWCMWTMYLPLALFLYVLRRNERDASDGIIPAYLISAALTLYVRFLCGFEYSSCMMVLVQLPLLYYAIKNRWSSKKYFLNALFAGIVSLAAFLFAFLSYFINVLICKTSGDVSAAWEFVTANLRYRTGVGGEVQSDIFLLSFLPELESIFEWHWNCSVFAGKYGGFKVSEIVAATGASFIAGMFLLLTAAGNVRNAARKYFALGAFAFSGMMLPFIWIITAKGHSYYHPHINFILWNISLVFMASLIGYTLSILLLITCNRLKTKPLSMLRHHLKENPYFAVLNCSIILGCFVLGFLACTSNYSGFTILQKQFEKAGITVKGTDIQYMIHDQTQKIFFKLPEGLAKSHMFLYYTYPVYEGNLDPGRERYKFNSKDFFLKERTFKASLNENFSINPIEKSFIAKPIFSHCKYEIIQIQLPSYPCSLITIGQYDPRSRRRFWTLELKKPIDKRRNYNVCNHSDKNWESGVFRSDRKHLLFTKDCFIFKGDSVTFPDKSVNTVARAEIYGQYVHVFLEKNAPHFNPEQLLIFSAETPARHHTPGH